MSSVRWRSSSRRWRRTGGWVTADRCRSLDSLRSLGMTAVLAPLARDDTRMRQLALGLGLRILLALLGSVAVIAGVAVGAAEVRSARHTSPPWPPLVVALICVAIVV